MTQQMQRPDAYSRTSTGTTTGTATGSTAATAASRAADPTKPDDPRTLGAIVHDISDDMSRLLRQEMELAKTELKQEATKAGKGAGMLGGAGIAGHMFLVFASLALTFLLANWLPIEAAALITAVLWGVVAAILALTGKKKVQQSNPQLPTTQRTLKEDVAWTREQTSR